MQCTTTETAKEKKNHIDLQDVAMFITKEHHNEFEISPVVLRRFLKFVDFYYLFFDKEVAPF